MPSRRIVTARREGTCSKADSWAHDPRIRPGDRTLVTTYMPTDEHVRWFGVPAFTRTRLCALCTNHETP